MMDIKKTYDVKKNWQGDPCLPKDYAWEGLRCNYSSSSSTRIIGLDLSDNDLTGPIPSFLAGFAFLRFLNLTRNKFWGSIPLELTEKANNGTLLLSMDGFVALIPNHCQSVQCTKRILRCISSCTVGAVYLLLHQMQRG